MEKNHGNMVSLRREVRVSVFDSEKSPLFLYAEKGVCCLHRERDRSLFRSLMVILGGSSLCACTGGKIRSCICFRHECLRSVSKLSQNRCGALHDLLVHHHNSLRHQLHYSLSPNTLHFHYGTIKSHLRSALRHDSNLVSSGSEVSWMRRVPAKLL